MRHSSDPQLSPSGPDTPPDHPAHPSYQSHSSQSAGSYCDLRPCPAGPPKPPTKSYVERLRVEEGRRDGGRQDGEGWFSAPQVETCSWFRPSRYKAQPTAGGRGACFTGCTGRGRTFHPLPSLADLCRFESPLLPAENKPLEMSVLKRVKELLAEVDARTAAKHITVVDCTVRTPQEAPNRSIQRAAPALTCFIALWTGGSNPGREPRGAENDGSDVGAGAADAAARTPAEARPAGAVNKHPRRPQRPSLTQIWIIFRSSWPLPPLIITLQMFCFHLCCPLIFRRAFCESGFLRSRMKRGFCSCQV